ncbi:MAG: GntR family transcriptional regulator [Cyanobacteria bacterium SZAS LIN-5]|nr:GntR family transcriptional regulator [Cyanobacteria bacterium SZAS LIN-5]RTL44932.1 MAG: GntR family transcriptional regulator [Candidatus Melainabacteria bacterium]
MKISIVKESPVPIRDQLIEQIALQIASGTLKGKEKLPSIRALAQRLGIHYSTVTAAYNHLADVGLLDVRQGSGVRVAGKAPEKSDEKVDLSQLFREFLARISESGYSRDDLRRCIEDVSGKGKVRRILAVDRNRDFHELLLKELRPHFSIPVETCTVEEVLSKPGMMDDSLVVTSLYHLFSFQHTVPDPTRLVACNIEPGRAELDSIKDLKSGSLVLLVSGSQTMLNMATKLLAATRGEEVAVRAVLTSDQKELAYMLKHSDLIICDTTAEAEVIPNAGKTKVIVFRLYANSTIDLIKERLTKWG